MTSPAANPAPTPRAAARTWLPRVLVESMLIVFSVLFALAMDQWLEDRERAAVADVAVKSIRAELDANVASVERARRNHLAMHDSLSRYVALREPPPPHVYLGGIFNPAPVLDVAWESARETGTTSDLPYELVLHLSRVYNQQARYRALGDALVQDLMMQIRREGVDPVLRDGATRFLLLQEDFATREEALLNAYRAVLSRLASSPE